MENMENIDPTFECDAPRFIDFALFRRGELEDDANADTWFGKIMSFEKSSC